MHNAWIVFSTITFKTVGLWTYVYTVVFPWIERFPCLASQAIRLEYLSLCQIFRSLTWISPSRIGKPHTGRGYWNMAAGEQLPFFVFQSWVIIEVSYPGFSEKIVWYISFSSSTKLRIHWTICRNHISNNTDVFWLYVGCYGLRSS